MEWIKLIYNWLLNHITLLGFIFATINIVVTLVNWHISKPKIEFYKPNFQNIFKLSYPHEYHYKDSKCIAFSAVSVANLSSNPCTISRFELIVDGYDSCYFKSTTEIMEEYKLNTTENGFHFIDGKNVLKMPCTIPPYGYAEGIILFPYAPEYSGDKIQGKIIARTAKKDFSLDVEFNRI